MPVLAIVRHGQSQWNLENRFTGEVDVELSPLGEQEAQKAGELLRPYHFEEAYTSELKRAIRTLDIILRQLGSPEVPVFKSPALNERNYGDLQGLNKAGVERQYGTRQLTLWRRSFDATPPHGESLAHTYERVIPYYRKEIETQLKAGKNILIVAHGNSLRALCMYLENISPEEIINVNIPTGVPKVYEFDMSLKLLKSFYLE